MRWHFYPPIKTFKGPLSKRKECCFNSVVAPFLGPFFSACIHPTLGGGLKFFCKEATVSTLSCMTADWVRPWPILSPAHALKSRLLTLDMPSTTPAPLFQFPFYMVLTFKRSCSFGLKNSCFLWFFCWRFEGVAVLSVVNLSPVAQFLVPGWIVLIINVTFPLAMSVKSSLTEI